MSRKGKLLRLVLLLFLSVPTALSGQRGGGGGGPEADFLRGVAEYYNMPQAEVAVLTQWGMAPAEIPVVLFLAGRAGVSPDVVVAQRQRGRAWIDISQGFGVHAGDFYVRLAGPTGPLERAYDQFSNTPASRWSELDLEDREIVALVNVRFMSRHLDVPPGDVIRALQGRGGVVAGYRTLRRRGP